jgi:hypothetical protein
MANQLFANNATTAVANPLTVSGTSLTVTAGTGSLFPSPSGGTYFYLTLTNSSGTIEIVKCTARSFDTFTIVRAQDGTTPFAWDTGSLVELRLVRANLNQFYQLGSDLGTPSAGNLTNCTNLQIPSGIVGTLPVVNGGTGATTLTNHGVLIGNGTSAVTAVAPGTSGNVLQSNGTNWTSATLTIPPSLGVGQTWTDVTSSRASGTTYTNSTGKPIMIAVGLDANNGNGSFYPTINGSAIYSIYFQGFSGGARQYLYTTIVAAGQTYSATYTNLDYWWELR